MELYWKQNYGTELYNYGPGLDLDDLWDSGATSAGELKVEIIFHMALWAMKEEINLDDVVGFTLDNDDDEVEIPETDPKWQWLDEVCSLVEHIKSNKHALEANIYLAAIKNQDWKWFDFDKIKSVEDEYHQDWSGDHEEFAREYMDSVGESIPDHMESYFDYEAYGEYLVEGYEIVEFAGNEYLLHE